MKRFPLLFAAGVLVLYACWAALEASRLPHLGAWTLAACAGIGLLHAIGLVLRQLWAWTFAILFFSCSALAYVVAAAWLGRAATGMGAGGDGWAALGAFFVGMIAVVLLLAGLASAAIAVPLGRARRAAGISGSLVAWILCVAASVASLGALGWLLGYEYHHRELRAQNECLAGVGLRCYMLTHRPDKFTRQERLAFARRGCEAAYDGSCIDLATFLDAGHALGSAEALALAARCRAGKPQLCQRLGAHLLAIGDQAGGAQYLSQACGQGPIWCSTAAESAQKKGIAELARRLYAQGCEGEDARSCRGLLLQFGAALPPGARQGLELRVCLTGDVNDCRALMRRDLRATCAAICEGTTEARMHSCTFCAREAMQQGDGALARAWLARNCQRGYRFACEELAKAGGPPGTDAPVQVGPPGVGR